MPQLTREEIKQRAAQIMIRSGLATMSEAAQLRGVTRQAVKKSVRGFDPLAARTRYLNFVWKKIIDKLS